MAKTPAVRIGEAPPPPTMSTFRVRKRELITKLKANRKAHRELFLEALEGYRKEVVAQLEVRLKDAKANKRISLHIGLVEPQDQTKDYDRAITALEMIVGEEVQLQMAEFATYVMDDWAWKGQFTATTSNYVNR